MNDEFVISMINILFDLESKINKNEHASMYKRNISKFYNEIESIGFTYKNPIGEIYNETRLDCDANFLSELNDKMTITEVIKPVIYKKQDDSSIVIQRAIVII